MIPGEDGQSHDRHVIDGDLDSLEDHNGGGHGQNKRFKLRQRQPENVVPEELNQAGTAKFVYIGNGLYKRVQLADEPQHTFKNGPTTNNNVHACCGKTQHEEPEVQPPQQYGNGQLSDDTPLPLMIAPMEFDGQPVPAQEEELLGELPSSLYFQASCILGDCQCGPSCVCEGCPVHDPARRIPS